MLRFLTLLFLISHYTLALAQTGKATVAFYNVENMFDHIDDPYVDDREFTPNGSIYWTEKKALEKINNIAKVIAKMSPDVIGLAEVENKNVLNLLINSKELKGLNYKYVHFDSPDERGIDVALLYKESRFSVTSEEAIRVTANGLKPTRDILKVQGILAGEAVTFYVNHWPSRSGGEAATAPFRIQAAKILRQNYLDMIFDDPNAKVIMMGDFNDNPSDKSIRTTLNAKTASGNLEESDLFNPFYAFFRKGYGSNVYQDVWHSFDQIIVSGHLINADSGLRYKSASVFRQSFLIEYSGQYSGYPMRSYSQGRIGYSDHLPVMVELSK